MKKLLLFLLLLLGFNSNARFVQINFNQGFDVYVVNTTPMSSSQGSSTSDAEINSILVNYDIFYCVSSSSSSSQRIIFVNYNGSNFNGLINDLNNNPNVSKVAICYDTNNYQPTFADSLYIKLISDTNGFPVGVNSNGNIVTNNVELNIIFDSFNVKAMEQLTPNMTQYFQIYFEGDITELKTVLDNFATVIESSFLMGVPMLLSNSTFEKSNVVVSPNPFSNNFNIQTDEIISNYSLSDITGKQLIETTFKNEIDNLSSQLNTGVYLLNIQFENGQKENFKLIKK